MERDPGDEQCAEQSEQALDCGEKFDVVGASVGQPDSGDQRPVEGEKADAVHQALPEFKQRLHIQPRDPVEPAQRRLQPGGVDPQPYRGRNHRDRQVEAQQIPPGDHCAEPSGRIPGKGAASSGASGA